MPNQPVVPPGGKFPVPATSTTPLLAFRCAPAIKPYLAEDVSCPAGILVDTTIVFSQISGAIPITLPSTLTNVDTLAVTLSLDGQTLAQRNIPLNSTKVELHFSLTDLKPRKEAFSIACTATYSAGEDAKTQIFHGMTSLSYLPNPLSGSVTKIDLRTGALLVKSMNTAGAKYETIFPIGFYTSFSNYLDSNLLILDGLKAQG